MNAPSSPPYPPQGPMYYMPVNPEGLMMKRNIWIANGLALVAIWIAVFIRTWSGDAAIRGFAQFLVVSAALVGSSMSLAGALGSKRTTDMQNLGLFLWAGLLLLASSAYLGLVG
ncbi:MAG TPA: hypothetical protein VJ326_10075 [Thermoplasmata archaeon]|nr:hypothetical protein [Thermoplasmata archaeon]